MIRAAVPARSRARRGLPLRASTGAVAPPDSQEVALNTGLDGAEEVASSSLTVEHDDRDFGVSSLDLGRRLDTGHVRMRTSMSTTSGDVSSTISIA